MISRARAMNHDASLSRRLLLNRRRFGTSSEYMPQHWGSIPLGSTLGRVLAGAPKVISAHQP